MKDWRFRPISRFISETIQDMAIVTMEDEKELVRNLLNGVISNDLERSTLSDFAKFLKTASRSFSLIAELLV